MKKKVYLRGVIFKGRKKISHIINNTNFCRIPLKRVKSLTTVAGSEEAVCQPDIQVAFPLQIWSQRRNRTHFSGRCLAPQSIRCIRRCPFWLTGRKQPRGTGSTIPRQRSSSRHLALRILTQC